MQASPKPAHAAAHSKRMHAQHEMGWRRQRIVSRQAGFLAYGY
jgi:hypothetical protein